MSQPKIHVDLPSEETESKRTIVAWLRSTVGYVPDLRTGREELSISCVDVVNTIMVYFHGTGIKNAVSLQVDGTRIFVDEEG